jgi:hypothetical protein
MQQSPITTSTADDTYEELDLDDEPLTPTLKQDKVDNKTSPSNSFSSLNQYTSPTSREDDPWRSSLPSSSSASRFSSSTSAAGMSVASPPALERVSTGTSRASGSMSGPSGAAILGVAVVDFNHLVSYLDMSIEVTS